MEKRLKKKSLSHLKDDISGYKKQGKELKEEIREDKDLIKSIKKSKNGKKRTNR